MHITKLPARPLLPALVLASLLLAITLCGRPAPPAYAQGEASGLAVKQGAAGASSSESGDAYEEDDSAGLAGSITTDGVPQQAHDFDVAGDNDWVYFDAVGGSEYTIETSNLGATSDTYLYLYGQGGTTEIAHDDDGGGGLASRIGWVAPSSGWYYVRVRHYSGERFGPDTSYSLAVTEMPDFQADAYESGAGDDNYGEATSIETTGTSQTHNFDWFNDYDWVSFQATMDREYTIQTSNLGPNCDTYLYLYDQNGSIEITHDDDSGGGQASRIVWTAPADGTYYVMVRHYSDSLFGAGTEYDLAVTETPPIQADTYESGAGDDNSGDATLIATNGTPQTHNFDVPGDNDWLKFDVVSGSQYVIQTSNLGANCDTYLHLYSDQGQTEVAHDDDGGGGRASRIVWTASTNSTYYVMVRHYSSARSGAGTSYDISISVDSPLLQDGYETDDSYSQASPVVVDDTPQTHNFHVAGDNDWAKFTAIAGTTYVMRTSNLGANCDTYLYLYDTDHTTVLRYNDDSGGGKSSLISWTAPLDGTGTYYLRVRHYFSTRWGPGTEYDLAVTTVSAAATQDQGEAILDAQDWAGEALAVALAKAPKLESVQPPLVVNDQSAVLTLRGSGFADQVTVTLDGSPLNGATVAKSDTVTVMLPAGFQPGTYKVFVTNPDGQFVTKPEGLIVVDQAAVKKIYLPVVVTAP